MNDTAKFKTLGLSGSTTGASQGTLMGAQAAAQRAHTRERAFHMAVQANGGATISTTDLLADADTIMAWLEKDGATSN